MKMRHSCERVHLGDSFQENQCSNKFENIKQHTITLCVILAFFIINDIVYIYNIHMYSRYI